MADKITSSALQALVRVSVWNSKLAAKFLGGVLNVSTVLREKVCPCRQRSVICRLLRAKHIFCRDSLHGLHGLGAGTLRLGLLGWWCPDGSDDGASLLGRNLRSGKRKCPELVEVLSEYPRSMSLNPLSGRRVMDGSMSGLHDSRRSRSVRISLSAGSCPSIGSGGNKSRMAAIDGVISWDKVGFTR